VTKNARSPKETPLDSSVARYLAQQTEQQELGNLSVATVNLRRYALGVLLDWAHAEGIEDAADLTAERLNGWLRWMLKRKRNGKLTSRETSRSYQRQAGPFLKWAKAPTDGFKPLKGAGYREKDVVTPDEILKMEKACSDERDRLIVRLLGQSALRVQELLNLRPGDLREDRVAKSYSVRVLGKGNASEQKKERLVPVDPDVYTRLKHEAEHGPVPGGEYIFYSRRRTSKKRGGTIERLTRSGVDQLIRNVAEAAKVSRSDRRIYPHVLRHAAISNWLLAEVPPATVARWAGHSDLKLIMTTYAHLGLDRAYEAFPVWKKK